MHMNKIYFDEYVRPFLPRDYKKRIAELSCGSPHSVQAVVIGKYSNETIDNLLLGLAVKTAEQRISQHQAKIDELNHAISLIKSKYI